jgi:hypothetical protein
LFKQHKKTFIDRPGAATGRHAPAVDTDLKDRTVSALLMREVGVTPCISPDEDFSDRIKTARRAALLV